MVYTYPDLACMIDHSLLHPTLTDAGLRAGCELARCYEVAAVCVKPYAAALAGELLAGSGVQVGTVVGFPHGNSRVDVKGVRDREGVGRRCNRDRHGD